MGIIDNCETHRYSTVPAEKREVSAVPESSPSRLTTTTSLASRPLTRALTTRQSPKPKGVKMGATMPDKVLFAADGFGKFGVMDADPDDWACEARRYYFNICGKYGGPVSTLLKKASVEEC